MIVELVNVGSKFQAFKKEASLVLQSADLNSKDFSLVLAEVLLHPQSLIYVETNCLTSKGIKRLNALLEDTKRMFDDRVWIILLTQKDSSGKFSNMIEKEFDLSNISSKRIYEEDQNDCDNKKKFIISKEDQTWKTGQDVMKISNLEKQIVDLKNLVESEKVEHVKTNSLLMQNASELEGKLQTLEAVNLTLLEDIESWKVKAEDYYNERQCLRQENEKFSVEIEEGKKRFGVLQEQIEKSDKDCHCLRVENERLLKSIVAFKEERDKNNNLKVRLEDCDKERLSLEQGNYKLTQEMNVCRAEAEKIMKDLGEREHQLAQLNDELHTSKGVIEELRELHQVQLEKTKLLQDNGICQSSKSEISCQTKSVTVSDSVLSSIVGKLDAFKVKFPNAGASELLHRSIKNLKCNTSYIRTEEKVQCSIKIDGGKGIIEHKDWLATVSTAALDDNLAKDDAYNLLLIKLKDLESET